MTGVFVVRDGDFVGVAAPSAHEAQRALTRSCPMEGSAADLEQGDLFDLKQNAPAKSEDRFRKQKGSVGRGAGKRGAPA